MPEGTERRRPPAAGAREAVRREQASRGRPRIGLHRVLCGRETACETCPARKPFESSTVAHDEIRLEIEGRPRHVYATAMPINSPYGDTEETILMLQDV